jgi:hypothetical protein
MIYMAPSSDRRMEGASPERLGGSIMHLNQTNPAAFGTRVPLSRLFSVLVLAALVTGASVTVAYAGCWQSGNKICCDTPNGRLCR